MRYFLNTSVGPPEVATREGGAAPSRLGAACPAEGSTCPPSGVVAWPHGHERALASFFLFCKVNIPK